MNEHSSRSHAIFIVTVESCKVWLAIFKNSYRLGQMEKNIYELAS